MATKQTFDGPLPAALRDEGDPGRGGGLLALVVAVVLLALLAVQVAHFRAPALARVPLLAPWIDTLCLYTGCEPAGRRDPSRIELLERGVQTHPSADGALLITATLVNRAPFAQPWPQLEIRFSDITGRMRAVGRFPVERFLHGADAEDAPALLAPDEPVRIMLEVKDPGAEAVSYQFAFR